jgi:hypothetical protein
MGDVPRANFNSDAFGFLPTTGATMNEYKNPSSRISSWQTASSPQQFNRASLWKNAYRDLCHDLKNARWLRGLGWFSGVIWCFGLVATSIYIGVATLNITGEACLPDGSFRLRPDQYSFWSSSGYFQITLGGGRLSFTQAKVIDITWDIVSYLTLSFCSLSNVLLVSWPRWSGRPRILILPGVRKIHHCLHGDCAYQLPDLSDYFSPE